MGSRLFLPPYMQPVEPNVPKQIVEGYMDLGNWMAREMRAEGFQGITTNSTYDAWSPSRAYSHYHGGVRILSETASARIATPITLKFEELTSREGYDPKKESSNFGPLWRGGEWKLRDITNYMTTAAFLLLDHAADNRQLWLRRFYEIGKEAVSAPSSHGFLIRPSERSGALFEILTRAGVEQELIMANQLRKDRSWTMSQPVVTFVRFAQPYAAFAKALLEPRIYPDLRDRDGHPIAPYDVTAHNLPLLLGVDVKRAVIPFKSKVAKTDLIDDGGEASAETRGQKNNEPHFGLYKGYPPSMDEGWTRWILEQEENASAAITAAELRSGNVASKYRAIIIPDQPARTILNGYRAGAMPPELTGGLGPEGVKALRQFVEDGGTLVFLNRASDFAIEQFKLPIKNVVAGLPRTEFYVPGSILRLELDTSHPIAKGMPKESIAWAEDSPVFEIIETGGQYLVPASAVKVIGWYLRDKDPLLSGWLLGGNRIKGKAALLEVTMGKGRLILFGFRPQYRAQSLATYPLFFNALKLGSE
jgi:hypothetical protein